MLVGKVSKVCELALRGNVYDPLSKPRFYGFWNESCFHCVLKQPNYGVA